MIGLHGPVYEPELAAPANSELTGAAWVSLTKDSPHATEQAVDDYIGFVLNVVTRDGATDLAYLVPRDARLMAALRLATTDPTKVMVGFFSTEETMLETMKAAATSPSNALGVARAAAAWLGPSTVDSRFFD